MICACYYSYPSGLPPRLPHRATKMTMSADGSRAVAMEAGLLPVRRCKRGCDARRTAMISGGVLAAVGYGISISFGLYVVPITEEVG